MSLTLKPLRLSFLTDCWRLGTQGHHWAVPLDGTEAVYISPSDLNGASNGARVVVSLHFRNDGKRSGRVKEIVDLTRYC